MTPDAHHNGEDDVRIVVLVKQVVDPLLPVSALSVCPDGPKILGPPSVPPVVNGYDEQAMEAALRIVDSSPESIEIIALSAGSHFVVDVFQRTLAQVDELVLVEDESLDTWNGHFVARVLAAAIRHLGEVDLVLCGRQASDWDHAFVPVAVASELGWPCLTTAKAVDIADGTVRVRRVLADGYQMMRGGLPAVVTVTSELGELRYPTMPMRLQARRRRPTYLTLDELGLVAETDPGWSVVDLSLLEMTRDCTFIEGDDARDAGRRLAALLLEERLVEPAGSERST